MICRYPVPLDMSDNSKHRIIYVPCGRCAWCLRQKRNEWFVRFVEESKRHYFTRFVTLDYRDEDLPIRFDEETGEIFVTNSKRDIQLYHKKLRNKYKFRFFLASEYGKENGRPHYHGIYWSDVKIPYYDLWNHGDHGSDLPATPASFKYVTKYILKGSFVPEGSLDNFHVMSRRPGIGVSFLQNYSEDRPVYRYYNKLFKMPSYYTRKVNELLSEELKKSISEQKIDYLSTQGKYESLYNLYNDIAPADQSIDDWINDLYGKDLRKQYIINKKS